MNRGREKIRQSYLAEEKARKEAEQAVLKATEEEVKPVCYYIQQYTLSDCHMEYHRGLVCVFFVITNNAVDEYVLL